LGVVGTSNSGKTLLVTGLVRTLRERGYRVGTVKHCPHGADWDVPGKDSWQHSQAGAEVTIVAAPERLALFRELSVELPLNEIVVHFQGLDLVIVEGYKHLAHPKILVRSAQNWPGNPRGLFALVGAGLPALDLPVYDPEDVGGLAGAVVERLGLS
jgi:molybdopterin-guanine dinucleotide biosynthesis protein MobB